MEVIELLRRLMAGLLATEAERDALRARVAELEEELIARDARVAELEEELKA